MLSRGAWVFAGLGLVLVALLALWMGKTLDTKAPIRIDRHRPTPVPTVPTLALEELAAREDATMRALVVKRADALAPRAAAQAYPSEDAAGVRCTFKGATLVHREGPTAYWDAGFRCVDPHRPDSLPNLTSISVRLEHDGTRWVIAN